MFDISSGPRPPCPECSLSKTVDATDNETFEVTAAPQSSTTSLQRANIARGNPNCDVSVWFNVATALACEAARQQQEGEEDEANTDSTGIPRRPRPSHPIPNGSLA
jgi:hypothetical protein